jgi:hypothetical protein
VATIYRTLNTSVVYHSLDGDYGLQALEEICSDLLPLYDLSSWRFLLGGASGKLLDLFLVSNPYDVGDFHQIAVPWSDHDMIFLSCCFERTLVATLYQSIH